ncbi:hypothetical protein KIN20_003540 [Parelaphostrongylus tenuis]|uniref:Uncharacterized protein n=1 Tax=Parelaphostrongylus tenuis TaxID=148309 RepID=A0AAD5MFU1_PARTN|nr:hypothetical protein KIN20_003540 [Parelaphostrongylus tenuis]
MKKFMKTFGQTLRAIQGSQNSQVTAEAICEAIEDLYGERMRESELIARNAGICTLKGYLSAELSGTKCTVQLTNAETSALNCTGAIADLMRG